jgi:hypothetical protein
MKNLKYMLLAVLFAGIIPASKAGNPAWDKIIKAPRVESRMSTAPAFAKGTIDFTAPIPEKDEGFDKCKKYKRKQVAGFVLIPLSLGAMAGGVYLIYTGAKNVVESTQVGFGGVSTSVSEPDKTKIAIGAGLGFIGAVLFPTGLVLGIKGGTNYNRDCRGGPGTGTTLNIRPTGNGINMALKF